MLLLLAGIAAPAQARNCSGDGPNPPRATIPLFYVTDRNDLGTGGALHWGKESDVIEHYGQLVSSLTRSCATLPAAFPAWWPPYSAPIPHHADSHFLIHEDRPSVDRTTMLAAMRSSLDAVRADGAPGDVILFIHGYNQSFSEAGRDAAELALDLPFRGAAIFYAWPSQGSLFHYNWDQTRELRAEPFVRELIRDIIDHVGPDHFHIVAHSMGNRAMIAALLDLARERPDLARHVTSVTLLSPDMDEIAFARTTEGKLAGISERITLFSNSRDRALALALRHNGGMPLGRFRDTPFVAGGLTTIDISAVSHSLTRHADFEDQSAIMREIAAGMAGQPIRNRFCLVPVQVAAGLYYRIDPALPHCPAAGPYTAEG